MNRRDKTASASVDRDVFSLPETLTIMSPRKSSVPRGQNSAKGADAPYPVRYQPDEIESIRAAAILLNMPISEFLRWVGYFTSQEVIRENKKWLRERQKELRKNSPR